MLKQSLHQKLLQKLAPHQIQLMKMIQLPVTQLEQRIKEELEENPALDEGKEDIDDFEEQDQYDDVYGEVSEAEEDFDFSQYMDDDIPSYKLSVKNKGADDEEKTMPYSAGTSFHEMLEAQLGLRVLSEKEIKIAHVLIGNLDDSGYLRREIYAIVDDLAFSQNIMTTDEEVENVLKIIQEFDPPGVGCRDLQECLLIQLNRKEHTIANETAQVVIEDFYEEFTKKHYDKIITELEITEEDLKDALDEVLKLNPKPGNSMGETQKSIEHITPDFYIKHEGDELELTLNARNVPDLKVSRKYSEMIEQYAPKGKAQTKSDKEALTFVKQKLEAAQIFIDSIQQRQITLYVTMGAIMEYQRDYFLTGDESKLKPMRLKDISELIDMDQSTISRVSNSKYVQTPFGTFLLKSFFSEGVANEDGEEVSNKELKRIIREAINEEDKKKPLTDSKLVELLQEHNFNMARRTIAKYREQMNIPVARLRKEL